MKGRHFQEAFRAITFGNSCITLDNFFVPQENMKQLFCALLGHESSL